MERRRAQASWTSVWLGRRDFLKTLGVASAALALGGRSGRAFGAGGGKPNIVLIVADDLGYGELGAQGCKDIPTPNIDSIAQAGVRFTNGYVSCPVCSPTRAGLMTGRYQQRFGHEFNPGPPETAGVEFGLPLNETTIAERLKTLGYATGMFGKWHLGFNPEMAPQKRGFDEFFGFLGGAHTYLKVGEGRKTAILRGEEPVAELDYTTDAFGREAVSFIERHKDEPFFVYLPFNSVHAPLEALQKYLDRFGNVADKKRQTFSAMLSAMDDNVGKVLGKLRELGIEDNTLVIFISDNGGPTAQTSSKNDPLRGFKGQVFEGGIRIPYMMQWKGRIPAGGTFDKPVISLDIHPTILAAVGAPLPEEKKLDGVDLMPYLAGKKDAAPHDRLFWRFGEQHAVRMGDWKLLKAPDGTAQMYNLAEDIGEKNDLTEKNPEKLKELQTAYDAWDATLIAPRWKRGDRGQRKGKGKGKGKKAKQ